MMKAQTARLLAAMADYDRDAALVHHFTKVHGFAAAIGTMEGLDEETQFILETASLVHDIGIRNAMRQYGRSDGKLQEAIGPGEAEALLRSLGGYTEEQIDRVTYLVGNHHTYTQVEGLDYQILIEADFLVNLHEFPERYRAILAAEEKIFQTASGKRLLHSIFLRKDEKSDT